MKVTTTDQPKDQQAKPLPPSKPDYIITSPAMLPTVHPKLPERPSESKKEPISVTRRHSLQQRDHNGDG